MNFKKKGATVASAILLLLGIFIAFVAAMTIYGVASEGMSLADSITASLDVSTGIFTDFLGPLFNTLLGTEDNENAFLMILAFILMSIVVVGTLDSINLFEDDSKGHLSNLAIGVIVSIIGVRFMPADLWGALTSPASAFVATILMALPFGALLFVTMKVKSGLARKVMWIFFMIFLSYLIFFPDAAHGGDGSAFSNSFSWIYLIFLVLSAIMMIFDSSVRRFIHKEKRETEMENKLADIDVLKRKDIRAKVEKWTAVLTDDGASDADKRIARGQLTRLRTEYGNDLSVI